MGGLRGLARGPRAYPRGRCEFSTDELEQRPPLGGAIDGKALPAGTNADIGEQARRILVEVKER